MKPIVICNRSYIWAGAFLLVLCAGAVILLDWLGGITLGVVMGVVFCFLGSQKVIFSETGIESRVLWWRSVTAWEEVMQVGITKVADQGSWGPHLLVTFAGGVPKTPGMGFRDWKQRNGSKCLYVPASEELRKLVCGCWGKLDFDSMK